MEAASSLGPTDVRTERQTDMSGDNEEAKRRAPAAAGMLATRKNAHGIDRGRERTRTQ